MRVFTIKRKRKNKYNNEKTIVDGIEFDSLKEANHYCELKMLRMAGIVKDFDIQVKFELQPKFTNSKGKNICAINYVADFVVAYPDGHIEVVDVKGFRTKDYELKKKMFEFKYPRYIFKEV